LKKELNLYKQLNSKVGEIALFREMQRILSEKYKCTFISETHQQYVNFKSPTTSCLKRRELSDLWLISYSPKKMHARMTFLQAKLERKPFSNGLFKFKGDYYQHDLLSKRPLIINANKKFNFPDNILKNSILESVGSFGIFYFDNKNNLDFAYSTASDIQGIIKKASCKTKTIQLHFKALHSNTVTHIKTKKLIELRQTLNADCFEFGLINLIVGTPIIDKDIISYLKIFLEKIKDEDSTVMDFLNYLSLVDDNNIENTNFNKKRFTNLFLINVDSIE
jgi:hypothetical protein